jgi:hypothetical protein
MAMEFGLTEFAIKPMAIPPSLRAWALSPTATELVPLANAPTPYALEKSPEAVLSAP